jgi:AbrB family looped-hinge helix DNA binding protein
MAVKRSSPIYQKLQAEVDGIGEKMTTLYQEIGKRIAELKGENAGGIDSALLLYYSYFQGNTVKITTKGQVTIPQELRRKYHIDAHAEIDFIDEDGRIFVRVTKKSKSRFRNILGRGDVQLSTEEILRLTRAD